ncbi:hypothetical protein GQ55_8G033800 [Panicum hallii var. hallii]|uniref:DUF4220 domain-containing protein n=1 Tax=Panicum hallii var. hallii TaxID=1504633 RepID=A0A2T7CK98_9POAL|nr:hypothetical protein GQ55_8G033800 [Panicum hallii var. hallii]
MSDIWSVVRWWEDWQLRILVLGSLGLQWFLLLAAPMRKYTIPRIFRTCIWLAYISSDALAIYSLATLFNRHARAMPAGSGAACPRGIHGGSKQQQSNSMLLEVLWAPILLIHLGGQEELTGYEIEDNELWTRHTVTLVSQVAVAVYAFCKSWPSASDWKLLAAAVLLFVIGVASFSEKPLALNRAKIKRLAAVSAWVQGTKKPSRWRERLNQFFLFEESNCFAAGMQQSLSAAGGEEGSSFADLLRRFSSCGTEGRKNQKKPAVALSEPDKVLMVLSDMSLLAAAKDLVARGKAARVEEVLPPLPVAEKALPRWLRSAFAFIYTRASVVVTPLYLVYHLLVVPALHIAALTLFATSDKGPYKRADVKITYIILCLTAALDVFAVFIRQLLYRLMAMTAVPALCETVPGYNLIDAARRESDKGFGWMHRCARLMGYSCREECPLVGRHQLRELYRKVAQTVIADLVDARDRDLASYRIFDSTQDTKQPTSNWALSKELQKYCGDETRGSLSVSFDRSVLLWHIATDLCFRCIDDEAQQEENDEEGELEGGGEGEGAEGEFEGGGGELEEVEEHQLLPPHQQRQGGGGGGGGGEEELEEVEQEPPPKQQEGEREKRGGGKLEEGKEEPPPPQQDRALRLHIECTRAISDYMAHLLNSNPEMLLTGSRHHLISEAMHEVKSSFLSKDNYVGDDDTKVFHTIEARKLAKELLEMPDPTRWNLMYRVWLGMLCYSASMCRGYLHAKSLGEGGEFLSFVWLVLSLKGAKSLADKLQMPPET